MPTTPPSTPRPFLFRCEHCGRTFPANPTEVRGAVRVRWPQCCTRDMSLYVVAERPAATATEVRASRRPLPRPDPSGSTASMPALPDHATPE